MTNDQMLVTLDGPGIGESGVPLETFTAVLGRIQSAMRLMVGYLGGREPSPGQPPSWMRDQSRMRSCDLRGPGRLHDLTDAIRSGIDVVVTGVNWLNSRKERGRWSERSTRL